MAYHEAVWVAVTASAPVIALANLVAVGDAFSLRFEVIDRVRRKRPGRFRPFSTKTLRGTFEVFLIGYINLTAQAGVLYGALRSLATSQDYVAVLAMPTVEALGVVACLLCAMLSTTLRYEDEKEREEFARNRLNTRLKPPRAMSMVTNQRQPAWMRHKKRRARRRTASWETGNTL